MSLVHVMSYHSFSAYNTVVTS